MSPSCISTTTIDDLGASSCNISEDDIMNLIDDVFIETIITTQQVSPYRRTKSFLNCTNTICDVTQIPKKRTFDTGFESSLSDQTYGWFVDIETVTFKDDCKNINCKKRKRNYDANVIKASTRHIKEDLSFKALIAPKQNMILDDELNWALAADIVDDVLSDCSLSSSNKSQCFFPL